MSHKATNYVTELCRCPNGQKLTRSEKLLMFVLADRHNKDSGTAHPSIGRLAHEALMSIRQVQRCLRKLVEKGVLKVEAGGGSHRNTNLYSFHNIDGTGDILTPAEGPERVTSLAATGDILTPVESRERVTLSRVTGDTLGGNGCHNYVTQTGKNRKNRNENENCAQPTLLAERAAQLKKPTERAQPFHPLFDLAKEYALKSSSGLLGFRPDWGPKDFVSLARMLNLVCHWDVTLEEFKRRWDLYLADPSAGKHDWSLRYFCSTFGRYSDWRGHGFDMPRISEPA